MRHSQTQNEGEARESAWCAECVRPARPRKNGLKCRKCHGWACNAACGRAVAALHCCRMSGVASHESQSQYSQGLSSSRRSTSIDARQMADVQYDQQLPNERVAHWAALQVVPTIPLAVSIVPIEVETVQPMQIGMATPRAGVSEPQGSAEAPGPAAVVLWTEEQLLELPTSLPAMRTIRHQPRLEHNTREALGTSHALSSPKDQATRLRVPPS